MSPWGLLWALTPEQQELQLEIGAAAHSLPREGSPCALPLCPMKVPRRRLSGVERGAWGGGRDRQKDTPWKDLSPGRNDAGRTSLCAGPGLGAEADTFCVDSDLNLELEGSSLNRNLPSPTLWNRWVWCPLWSNGNDCPPWQDGSGVRMLSTWRTLAGTLLFRRLLVNVLWRARDDPGSDKWWGVAEVGGRTGGSLSAWEERCPHTLCSPNPIPEGYVRQVSWRPIPFPFLLHLIAAPSEVRAWENS